MGDVKENVETPASILEYALSRDWNKIIVDIGSGNYVSTSPEEKELLILIDPQLEPENLDYGANGETEGTVLPLKTWSYKVLDRLRSRADRVQIIAPDPDDILKIVLDATEMIKDDGEVVIIFDLISNKRHQIRNVITEIKAFAKGNYSVKEHDSGEADPNEFVDGELNSEFIPGEARIVVLQKRNGD